MYNIFYPYPINHPTTPYTANELYRPIPSGYPPVDVNVFSHSIKSQRILMEQGSILLGRLEDVNFARKLMEAAQQGKKVVVDNFIKSVGLRLPVTTNYTPSGITFELRTNTNCCKLSIYMKWEK